MHKILITEGTTSLAFKVKNRLVSSQFEVALGTSGEFPSILKNNYLRLSKVDSPSYVHEMLKLAINSEFDYILPLSVAEIVKLGQSLVLFEEYGIKLLLPTPSQLEVLQITNQLPKEPKLVLLDEGVDLFESQSKDVMINGLGILSDSSVDFILVVS